MSNLIAIIFGVLGGACAATGYGWLALICGFICCGFIEIKIG